MGGFWRWGPSARVEGEQHYLPEAMVLETRWKLDTGELVLWDLMLWPETDRAPEQLQVRTVVRRLRCTAGQVRCGFALRPACDFRPAENAFSEHASGFSLQLGELPLRVWASVPLKANQSRLEGEIELRQDQEAWAVLDAGAAGQGWSVEAARNATEQTQQYWRQWLKAFRPGTAELPEVCRSAMVVHLLTYAPEGSVVAAPTTSLPERVGGDWNADYRLCWVRDASLSLGLLAKLGGWKETERYLDWLVKRQSRFGHPYQVLYDIRGGKRPSQRELAQPAGYRGSKPVRMGNHAYKQQQLGSLGFLADCIWAYLNEGGPWREDYWRLIRRSADYITKHWREPDNGIWELSHPSQFVHSKVLCWVALDRAIKIAKKANASFDVAAWQTEQAHIHAEVMERGWSEALGAFRQHYEGDNLDAAELLIPILGFLPANHPRVLSTIERIAQRLTINGLVYRFDPLETPGIGQIPMGQMEGAFVPCTCWLATAYALAGQTNKAVAVLRPLEQLTRQCGLLPEGIDARNFELLGNTPLLFSHVEFARAKLAIAQAQSEKESARKAA